MNFLVTYQVWRRLNVFISCHQKAICFLQCCVLPWIIRGFNKPSICSYPGNCKWRGCAVLHFPCIVGILYLLEFCVITLKKKLAKHCSCITYTVVLLSKTVNLQCLFDYGCLDCISLFICLPFKVETRFDYSQLTINW